MTLIKSISGIRGTIGDAEGDDLTGAAVKKYTLAFIGLLQKSSGKQTLKIVIGRDARTSGPWISEIVCNTAIEAEASVIDLGLATTPTVEMSVKLHHADGGIIITASHNPGNWNALKLLNNQGEFISAEEGAEILHLAEVPVNSNGKKILNGNRAEDRDALSKHIKYILNLPLVDTKAISRANFKIAVDGINSVGGFAVPALLEAAGVKNIEKLNCVPDGIFSHNPEPLPENIKELAVSVVNSGSNLGIVVDPDVDRLAFICEDGSMFGEEYTLVAIADFVLQNNKGSVVSNLSSTKALSDVAEWHGCSYFPAAVGEVNVVAKMKEVSAVIGGEGNGGVIYPDLHYGRDALVGIALFLSHLARSGKSCRELRKIYPDYYISKNKIQLCEGLNVDNVLKKVKKIYHKEKINDIDGLRIDFKQGWVHLRKSNTEPIIRIYAESSDELMAQSIAEQMMTEIKKLID